MSLLVPTLHPTRAMWRQAQVGAPHAVPVYQSRGPSSLGISNLYGYATKPAQPLFLGGDTYTAQQTNVPPSPAGDSMSIFQRHSPWKPLKDSLQQRLPMSVFKRCAEIWLVWDQVLS